VVLCTVKNLPSNCVKVNFDGAFVEAGNVGVVGGCCSE
jgi:hypothetical protein